MHEVHRKQLGAAKSRLERYHHHLSTACDTA